MNRRTATLVLSVAVIWVGFHASVLAQGAQPVVWPAGAIKWTANPAVKGAMQAVLWGDPATGAYGALKKVPAGTVLAPHTHTGDTRVLMIAGALKLTIGGKTTDLGVGSYGFIPGGAVHDAACGAAAECQYFETSDKAFDSKPAK